MESQVFCCDYNVELGPLRQVSTEVVTDILNALQGKSRTKRHNATFGRFDAEANDPFRFVEYQEETDEQSETGHKHRESENVGRFCDSLAGDPGMDQTQREGLETLAVVYGGRV